MGRILAGTSKTLDTARTPNVVVLAVMFYAFVILEQAPPYDLASTPAFPVGSNWITIRVGICHPCVRPFDVVPEVSVLSPCNTC